MKSPFSASPRTILQPLLVCVFAISGNAATIDYAAKIAPLFQEHCIDCHGKDDPDGDFNLETYANLLKGGENGKAFEPGKANESVLVKFLEGRSGKEGKNKFMPPGKRDHLKPEEIALIREWIDAGAPAPAAERTLAEVLASLPKIAVKADRKKAIHALAFSPKAKLIAVGTYGTVQLLDAATRTPVRSIDGASGKVNALVFSADGSMLFGAAGDPGIGGIAYQWKVSDGVLVRQYAGHKDTLYALALSPDGQTLATGSYDQKIKLWNAADGTERKTLPGHTGAIFGLCFRPDGKILASASADRTVKLWDTASGARLDTFSQPFKEQAVVTFSPDGKVVAAAGTDSRIRVWKISENGAEGSNPLVTSRFAHEGAILSLAFAADGKSLVSTAADKTVKVWDAASLTEKIVLETQPDWSPALALLDGDQVAIGRLDGAIAYYNTATGKPVAAMPYTAPIKKAAAKPAMTSTPEITRLEPAGVQSGTATRIAITGKNLKGLKEVKIGITGIHAEIARVDESDTSAELLVTTDQKVPRTQTTIMVVTPTGASGAAKLFIDYLPQIVTLKSAQPTMLDRLPLNIWGTLTETGQQDSYRFSAKKGETLVFDLAAKRIDSKAVSTRLEILDSRGKLLAGNNGLDSGSDPFIAFTVPRDGDYVARVLEITLEGSPAHNYRLTAGALPYVTGWWPLSVPANRESTVNLIGHNLKTPRVTVKAGTEGKIALPLDTEEYRGRVAMSIAISSLPEVLEQEPNDTLDKAQPLSLPASVNGRLFTADNANTADADLFRIEASKWQQIVFETQAAMMGSAADTRIDVLDANGAPVPQLLLQATKDSWITLRSKDANDPNVRLGQFDEMELNDYMYFNGEVVRISRLARGPDSDMVYFSRDGKRRTSFFSSPTGHGLDEPCYVVEPKSIGSRIVANGLPVFTLNYANDDDSERQLGKDSRLLFTAPDSGSYFVRVTDTRAWSGERMTYRLIARPPQPDFTAKFATKGLDALPRGSGSQFLIEVDRQDGFEGDVRVDISGVPAGFFVSTPVVVQAGHLDAAGCLYALPDSKPGPADFSKVQLTATAQLNGQTVAKNLDAFPKVNVAAAPKQLLFLEGDLAGKPQGDGKTVPPQPYEITIEPGGRIPVWLRVDRKGNDALLALDIEGLPHGVIVDSIGLSGVQVRANETEREVFLSCARWVKEQDRLCHLITGNARANESQEGIQASFPVLLKIRRAPLAVATGGK